MKLFIFASRFPFPLERGDKLRLFHQIRGLSKDHEIHLFAIYGAEINQKDLQQVRQYCKSIHLHKVSKFKKVVNALLNIGKRLPFQASTIYSSRFQTLIKTEAEKIQPDALFCQLIRMAPYAQNLKAYKVLDYMDAYGIGMERRAKIVTGYLKFLYQFEAKKTLEYEKRIYKHFNHHCIISNQDASLLGFPIDVIPNGIDLEYFKPIESEEKYDIGFIGNMGYLPNVEAAEILCNQIAEAYFEKHKTHLKILIAGARPHSRVKQLENANIKVTGWVDDIRNAYSESKIICAPLQSGTGQQNKVLEAMAMGVPCITTTSVNAAFGAMHMEQLLIADQINEYVDAIHRLLHDDQLNQNIRIKSRKFVEENFSWESSLNKLRSLLQPKQ